MSITVLVLVIIEILLIIGIPVAAVLLLRRRWGFPLSIAIAGAVTFIGSQILHVPANSYLASTLGMEAQPLILQSIVLGLSAGVFEEVARYIVYRFWQTDVRTWQEATFFGLGHGAVEAILIGLVVALTLINMVVVAQAEDPTVLGLPEGALAQVQEFWAMPLYTPVLAVVERLMALILHTSLATLVALCFSKRTIWPLFAAILWHALADTVSVFVSQTWGNLAAEGALTIIALLSLVILRWTHETLTEAEV
jgi:uncharacterized membrane protein YhfC